MLKHFSCISVDDHVKTDAAEIAAAAAAEAAAATEAADNDRVSSSTAKASTGKDATASSSFLESFAATDHLVTLPPATPTVGVTFRLFASNGKLLAHFEDDLELYPTTPTAGGARCSVTRDPVAFHLPTEASAAKEMHHRNNSYFGRRQEQRSCSGATTACNTPTPVSAASPASTLCTAPASEPARCDQHFHYYGSIRGLRSQLSPCRQQRPETAHRLRSQLSPCRQQRPETAHRLRNRLSPLLMEPDGRSGCTASVGCVPSVPVARSRLTTHRGAPPPPAGR